MFKLLLPESAARAPAAVPLPHHRAVLSPSACAGVAGNLARFGLSVPPPMELRLAAAAMLAEAKEAKEAKRRLKRARK